MKCIQNGENVEPIIKILAVKKPETFYYLLLTFHPLTRIHCERVSEHLRRCITEEYKEEFKMKGEKYLGSKLSYLDGKSGERVVKSIGEIVRRRENK